MALMAVEALPEIEAAVGGGEAGGGGMLSKLMPGLGSLGGGHGGGGSSSKPNPEQAEAVAHETLGNLNRAQFG